MYKPKPIPEFFEERLSAIAGDLADLCEIAQISGVSINLNYLSHYESRYRYSVTKIIEVEKYLENATSTQTTYQPIQYKSDLNYVKR